MLEVHKAGPAIKAVNLDFLVGLEESVAYELAQDHGFVVRVVQRDDIAFRYTMEVNPKRVNLSIADNTVLGWHIG